MSQTPTVSVYAAQGPLVNIGPPNNANSLAAFSDGETIHVVYAARTIEDPNIRGVYYGLVLSGPGERSAILQDPPQRIRGIDDDPNTLPDPGIDEPNTLAPKIFVTGLAGGRTTYIVADSVGDEKPKFTTCRNDDTVEEASYTPVSLGTPSNASNCVRDQFFNHSAAFFGQLVVFSFYFPEPLFHLLI